MRQAATCLDASAAVRLDALRQVYDDDFFAEILNLYVSQTRMLLDNARHAVESGNPEEASRAVHGLKGASLQMCMEPMALLSERAEAALESWDLPRAASLLDEMEREFAAERAEIAIALYSMLDPAV